MEASLSSAVYVFLHSLRTSSALASSRIQTFSDERITLNERTPRRILTFRLPLGSFLAFGTFIYSASLLGRVADEAGMITEPLSILNIEYIIPAVSLLEILAIVPVVFSARFGYENYIIVYEINKTCKLVILAFEIIDIFQICANY